MTAVLWLWLSVWGAGTGIAMLGAWLTAAADLRARTAERDQWRELARDRITAGAYQAIAAARTALADLDAQLTDSALRQEDQR